ncbi:hypothetical protein RRX38_23895 [Pseudomonas sp. DTU_2021_1001937_2_SI_NGA_ILE_001]|uniref:hypothetical protein n=1 Tax=Pseudomonas sp. DTU_2021_1001937_2_SI_NGA_ILE_001 TaxID=3077589 RepID=UPI0028FC283E|nr:hypothetical protein [Pseudomonas sp. DTU_2021_1001937_2_SI_NGA_ILE_001]WNW14067.1 hypothetical protein RRX38_23895 [Pseudomonas sp. DTU_2021_1001937_2_SI_NGA_ILE_001]
MNKYENDYADEKIPLKVWAKELFLPWLLRHWAIWFTPIAGCTGALCAFAITSSKPVLWWISFILQVIGLVLSAGSLIYTAYEMKAGGPLASLKKIFADFPPYRKPRIVRGYARLRMPSLRVGGSLRVKLSEHATDRQRIDELNDRLNLLEAKSINEFHTLSENNEELTFRVELLEDNSKNKHNQLSEQIRGISIGNFYQVLLGLIFLSLGSILSLFLT